MKLTVVSYKECWADLSSSSGYSTIGGFPFQIKAISELFDETILVLPLFKNPPQSGLVPLTGHNLSVSPFDGPPGSDLRRKLALLLWLPRNLPIIWRATKKADAIHTPVPGDIGTIGILLALAQRKRLFVRHCGTWGNRATIANRFILWLLPRIARGRNVVMATGGGNSQPCANNANIDWIFATTISRGEMKEIPQSMPLRSGDTLKLVTVSRLDRAKNTQAILRALPKVQKSYYKIILNIVGDGPCLEDLKALAKDLNIESCIRFYGRLDHENVLKVLSDSHLFVLPTQVKEGFPKAVLEAMACGLPVIATSISVIPQLIGNRNGFVLECTDSDAVSESILKVISDENSFADMTKSARETSLEYTLERWQEIIQNRLTTAWGPLRDGQGNNPSKTSFESR